MTIAEDFENMGPVSGAIADDRGPYEIDETYWGYIVRSNERPLVSVILVQLLAWGVGVSFALATLGLWLMPSTVFHGSVLGMKIGGSVLTGAIAAFSLWFASRGADSEIQIDTSLGEVREVVRNRAGRPTLLGRYGFDSIGAISIEVRAALDEHKAQSGLHQNEGELILQYRNTAEKLYVARGATVRLGALRDRIGRDMMLPIGQISQGGKLAA